MADMSEFSVLMWGALLGVLLVTVGAALYLAKNAAQMKLLAFPGAHRQHQNATPMVGGLAMYFGLMVGFFIVDDGSAQVLPSLFLLTVVGALDDRYSLPSWSRFLAQALAVYLMVELTGVRLLSLGYLTPKGDVLLGDWSVAMTIFASIGVINAINMSDGHDGLAGSLVFVVLLGLLTVGVDTGFLMILAAVVLGFLTLNLRVFRTQARVFMGDAGSTMLGLALAYVLIRVSQSPEGIWPVTALWLLALPLIDAVAVLIVRPLRGKSPFSADRIHYHHQLVDRGVSVNLAVLIAVSIQAGFIVLGLTALRLRVAEHLQLMAFLGIFVLYLLSLFWFTRATKARVEHDA